jgi:glycosyltransferase involved in cell wall biosynthesis
MPDIRDRLRLVMIGDGSLRAQVEDTIAQAGLSGQAWLPGARGGIDDILRGLDVFVLPSLSEGISNTILEAMATGLPIVATRTGGNPELVQEGETGLLPAPANDEALALAIGRYVQDPVLRVTHGTRARQVALERYSLGNMVSRYADIYRELLEQRCPGALQAVKQA